jgi:hypothetical protein
MSFGYFMAWAAGGVLLIYVITCCCLRQRMSEKIIFTLLEAMVEFAAFVGLMLLASVSVHWIDEKVPHFFDHMAIIFVVASIRPLMELQARILSLIEKWKNSGQTPIATPTSEAERCKEMSALDPTNGAARLVLESAFQHESEAVRIAALDRLILIRQDSDLIKIVEGVMNDTKTSTTFKLRCASALQAMKDEKAS